MVILCLLLMLLAALPSMAQEPSVPITHHIQVLGGGAYTRLGYPSNSCWQVQGKLGGEIQLRYVCAFTPHWGLGIGAGGSYYASTTVQNQVVFSLPNALTKPSHDSENETYTASYRTRDWTTAQSAWMIEVPLVAQYSYAFENCMIGARALRLWVDAGVCLGFNVHAKSQVLHGSLSHLGYYELWNLHLQDIDTHDFYTEEAQVYGTELRSMVLRQPAVGLILDVGTALPVGQTTDILLGIYAHQTVNDIRYRDDYTPAMMPMQVGLRLGVSFHTHPQP